MDQRQRLFASAIWSAKHVSISFFWEKTSSKAEAGIFFGFRIKIVGHLTASILVALWKWHSLCQKNFLRKNKFLTEMFSVYKWCILSVKRPIFGLRQKTRFSKRCSACLSGRFEEKKCLKEYSKFNFLGIKKIGTSGKQSFRWVLKRGWHVSEDYFWGNNTLRSEMFRLLLLAHVEHATSNFLGPSNGQGCRVSFHRSKYFFFTSFAFWHFERKSSETLGKNVRRLYQKLYFASTDEILVKNQL